MWTTILIFLAKQLISYFLATNANLSRQLDEAVQRNEDFQKGLNNLDEELVQMQDEREDIEDEILSLDTRTKVLHEAAKSMQERYEKLKAEVDARIDLLDVGDAIRADIFGTDSGG